MKISRLRFAQINGIIKKLVVKPVFPGEIKNLLTGIVGHENHEITRK